VKLDQATATGHLVPLLRKLNYPEAPILDYFNFLFYADFGVTEFSFSLSQSGTVNLRTLAEMTTRTPCAYEDTQRILAHLTRLFEFATEKYGHRYDLPLFTSVYQLVYGRRLPETVKPRAFRFGLAAEFHRQAGPTLKCYFDLGAAARAGAGLAEVFRLLGLPAGFDTFETLLNGKPLSVCRGIGIDFHADARPNIKLYLSGKAFTVRDLRDLLPRLGLAGHQELLDHFNACIWNGKKKADDCMGDLIGLVFSEALPTGLPLLKIDAFLPARKADDHHAWACIRDLAGRLNVNTAPYAELLPLLAGNRDLQAVQNLHQYVSLDFIPGAGVRLNLYTRPFRLCSEYMKERYTCREKTGEQYRLDAVVTQGLTYLEKAGKTGYSEAVHEMIFPPSFVSAPDDGKVPCEDGKVPCEDGKVPCEDGKVRGDVFQRTIIVATMLTARRSGYHIDSAALSRDIDYIIAQKDQESKGGWKYFPRLSALPPDTDDLAQVILVLLGAGHDGIAGLVDECIDLAIENMRRADGMASTADGMVSTTDGLPSTANGLPSTWVLDLSLQSHRRLAPFIEKYWGDTADTEVIANFMYALHQYNPAQYALFVIGGVELISRQITPRGSWTSTWYSGEYYGTYICARLVAAVDPAHPLLPRIADFLLAAQQDDGGWGPDRSNVNDTAFALLALHALHKLPALHALPALTFDKTSPVVTAGCRFLIDRQREDGSWQGVNFIRMDPFRTRTARGGSQKNELHYRSDVISSCFCLQALCLSRLFASPGRDPLSTCP
jgi:hypothetical protein